MRGTALASVVLGMALVTGTAITADGVPERPEKQGKIRPQEPGKMKSVGGQTAGVKPRKADPATAAGLRSAPAVVWPTATATEVVPGARAAALSAVTVAAGRSASAPGKVRIEVLDRAAAAKARVAGLLVRVRRTDGGKGAGPVSLTANYSGFRHAYGGDWASRLRLTTLDGKPLPSRNDTRSGTVTAPVSVAGTDSTFVLAAAPEGSTGDYKATSLSPSGKWQVSANSGTFSWSYALRTPTVPGRLAPPLTASYSSAGADGRTVSTNSQPSWLGEGWDLGIGFIERSYKGCGDDLGGNNGQTKTGDLCWETENATLSLGGQSGELVHNGNNVWRPKQDDGSRVEHLFSAANGDDNGEYWKVTKTDGTQYFFGRRTDSAWNVPVFGNDPGEPCNSGVFATSHCVQTYRWNLDHVVDTHGNTVSYIYAPETNNYGLNLAKATASYTRGGTLLRIEYGTRDGQAGTPPAKVLFETADRCIPGANCSVHTTAAWPDVPWDQDCAAAPCTGKYSPTFWSTKRLAKVTTYAGDKAVDSWAFDHTYPAPGDNGGAALWLRSVTHTGLAGATPITLPALTFDGTAYPNRVNSATDGMPPMNKYRIHGINTESGGIINIKYAPTNCAEGNKPAPDTNTLRCFPVRWSMPPATTPVDDWFHKYVVAEISQVDRVGNGLPQLTSYEYVGGGAWHYKDNPLVAPERRTWSEWRGYEKVIIRKGDPVAQPGSPRSQAQYQYFRGMNGDKLAAGGTKYVPIVDSAGVALADDDTFAGFLREEITYNGVGGAEVSGAIHDPWRRGPTASQGSLQAYQVANVRTVSRIALAAGGFRRTERKTAYDEFARVTQVDDLGDVAKADDDQCTTTSYAANTSTWMLDRPSQVRTVGVACGQTPVFPGDAISDVRNYYDGNAFGAAPSAGDVTRVEHASSYDGSAPQYVAVSRATYDEFGRTIDGFDALDRKTSTRYTMAAGLTTGVTETNALGHVTTTSINPVAGTTVAKVDANGRRTDLAYDGLGRLTGVWLPGRVKGADGPNSRFAYGLRADGPSWVRTEALRAGGNYVATYTLLDGFLRTRQTQTASAKGGRVLTDTLYDTRGLTQLTRQAYWNSDAAPGTALFLPRTNQVPSQTANFHDGAERQWASAYLEFDVEQWRTTTSHGGDHVSIDPPAGGTATTRFTDARGRAVELRQYKSGAPSGAFDATRYTHTKAGQLATITDAAGNQWRYTYDVRGRKLRADDPDKGTSTFEYDVASQLLAGTDARGSVVTHKYDLLGRKTETRRDSATGPLLASWTYDTLALGAQTSSTRFAGGAAYTKEVTGYDDAGRPEGEKVTIPAAEGALAGTFTTSVTYRADGSTGSTTLPALGDLPAETVVNGYDDLGRPQTLTGDSKYIASTDYSELNEQQRVELGAVGQRVWQTTYYEEGTRRLGRVLTEKEQTAALVDRTDYGYDPTGNLTSIENEQPGSVDMQCFRYDYLRRTTDAWTATDRCAGAPATAVLGGPAPYWHSYTYDVIGNRKAHTRHGFGGAADSVSTYTYPTAGAARPHAVQSISTTGHPAATFGYDATGNMTSRFGQTLAWDDDGSLSKAGDSTYVYDADDAQLIRRDKDAVTLFVGGGELRLDKATGARSGTRYYGSTAVRTSAGLVWLVADHHNTSQVAINATTLTSTTRRFDNFGNSRSTGAQWPGGNRGFVGGTTNSETGLTRLGAREYDPAVGKFISVDPVIDPDDPQQLNAYNYSNNNPTSFSDPDGLRDLSDCDAWGNNCGGSTAPRTPQAPPTPPPGPEDDAGEKTAGGYVSLRVTRASRIKEKIRDPLQGLVYKRWNRALDYEVIDAREQVLREDPVAAAIVAEERQAADRRAKAKDEERAAEAKAKAENDCNWLCRRSRELGGWIERNGTTLELIVGIAAIATGAGVLVGASLLIGVANTAVSCANGDATGCALGVASVAFGGAGAAFGKSAARSRAFEKDAEMWGFKRADIDVAWRRHAWVQDKLSSSFSVGIALGQSKEKNGWR